MLGVCHRYGKWHTSQMRKPLAMSLQQCKQQAGLRTASLSVLTFILFTNLPVVMIVLKSWDLPSRKTQHRVPTASLQAGVRGPHVGPGISTASGDPRSPITGLRVLERQGAVLSSPFRETRDWGRLRSLSRLKFVRVAPCCLGRHHQGHPYTKSCVVCRKRSQARAYLQTSVCAPRRMVRGLDQQNSQAEDSLTHSCTTS